MTVCLLFASPPAVFIQTLGYFLSPPPPAHSPAVPVCHVPLEALSVSSSIPVIVALFARRNTSKRGESFGISRIGSKIKGVFKSTTMEGAMLPSSGLVEGEDDLVRATVAQPVEI